MKVYGISEPKKAKKRRSKSTDKAPESKKKRKKKAVKEEHEDKENKTTIQNENDEVKWSYLNISTVVHYIILFGTKVARTK